MCCRAASEASSPAWATTVKTAEPDMARPFELDELALRGEVGCKAAGRKFAGAFLETAEGKDDGGDACLPRYSNLP